MKFALIISCCWFGSLAFYLDESDFKDAAEDVQLRQLSKYLHKKVRENLLLQKHDRIKDDHENIVRKEVASDEMDSNEEDDQAMAEEKLEQKTKDGKSLLDRKNFNQDSTLGKLIESMVVNIHGKEKTPLGLHPENDEKQKGNSMDKHMPLPNNIGVKRNFIGKRWWRGIVPYVLEGVLGSDDYDKKIMLKAFEELSDKTCIKMVPKDDSNPEHNAYIKFFSKDGCWSYVGNMAESFDDGQPVSLESPGCVVHSTVLHEIMHALGMEHEQSRADRDDHIKIKIENIDEEHKSNFDKADTVDTRPYDAESVLQYSLYIFGKKTMEFHDKRLEFLADTEAGLDFYDVADITDGYSCSDHCTNKPACENGGFVDHKCKCYCPTGLKGKYCEEVDTSDICGGIVDLSTSEKTEIISPGWPDPYAMGTKCTWLLKAPESTVVEITIDELKLPYNPSNVCYHWLEIRFNLIGQRGPKRCGKFSEEIWTASRFGNPNLMMLRFDSSFVDKVEYGDGFQITAIAVDSDSNVCPAGWRGHDGSCYHISTEKLKWHNAQEKCKEHGGKLAEPDTESANVLVKKLGAPYHYVWIGATDEDQERQWVWASNKEKIQKTYWGRGEPNDISNEDCLAIMSYPEYKWNDIACDYEGYYICEKKIQTAVTTEKTKTTTEKTKATTEKPKWTTEKLKVTTNKPTVKTTNTPTCTLPPSSLCPDGWSQNDGKCYYLSSEVENWMVAQDTCKQKGGILAEPVTKPAMKFVNELAKENQLDIWLGGTDESFEGIWLWRSNVELIHKSYWAKGEPSDGNNGEENCLFLQSSDSIKWHDAACREEHNFICEKDLDSLVTPPPGVECPNGWVWHGGLCYFISSGGGKSWSESKAICEQNKGKLAEPKTKSANAFIKMLAKEKDTSVWIGGTDTQQEGIWVWDSTNEMRIGTTFWPLGEPHDSDGSENCLAIQSVYMYFFGDEYVWSDADCIETWDFVCEKEIQTTAVTTNKLTVKITNTPTSTLPPSSLCPDGWNKNGEKCYHLSSKVENWLVARKTCEQKGGILAEPVTKSAIKFVNELAKENQLDIWLGGTDGSYEGIWHWRSNFELIHKAYWAKGEPSDDNNGEENCLFLQSSDRDNWHDGACMDKHNFICEKDLKPSVTETPPGVECPDGWVWHAGLCYFISSGGGKTWSESKVICEQNEGKLAEPKTRSANSFIKMLAKEKNTFVWIGGTDQYEEGKWVWDSTNIMRMGTTFWLLGEPHDSDGHENCLTIRISQSVYLIDDKYAWSDADCMKTWDFVCEKDLKPPVTELPPVVECPDGWVLHDRLCYLISSEMEGKTWSESQATCEQKEGKLAEPKTTSANKFIKLLTKEKDTAVWIGGTDKYHEGKWIWNSTNEKMNITFWPPGEPHDSDGSENCLTIKWINDGYDWSDDACKNTFDFVCEKEPVTPVQCPSGWVRHIDICYFINSDPKDWSDALDVCKHNEGILAEPVTKSAIKFVNELAKKNQLDIWLGGIDGYYEGKWVWQSTIEKISTTYWVEGEPSDNNGKENCLFLASSDNYTSNWHDAACSEEHDFICEKDLQPLLTEPPPGVKCPDGWIWHQGLCYFISSDEIRNQWSVSKIICDEKGGKLAEPKTRSANKFIKMLTKEKNTAVWIGGTDKYQKGEWVWDSTKRKIETPFWPLRRPHESTGYDCLSIRQIIDSYGWSDAFCSASLDFVCEKELEPRTPVTEKPPGVECPDEWVFHEGLCYFISSDDMGKSWSDSKTICEKDEGKLAEPVTRSANKFIIKLTKEKKTGVWIGGIGIYQEGKWVWQSTKGEIEMPFWPPGKPNAFGCISIKRDIQLTVYAWSDDYCGNTLDFVCQKEPKVTPIGGCVEEWINSGELCYWIGKAHLTWDQAQESCLSKGGNLAEPVTKKEISFLSRLTKMEAQTLWIGGTGKECNNGSWCWASNNQSNIALYDWGDYQSDWNSQHCINIQVSYDTDSRWQNEGCNSYHGYICQM